MNSNVSRRRIMQAIGAVALSRVAVPGPAARADGAESVGTPKICLQLSLYPDRYAFKIPDKLDEVSIRRVKQLGVDHVLTGGPAIPWEEGEIRSIMETLKSGGLTLGNMMISGFPKTLYGKPGRDEEIDKVRLSIRAAGRAGLPVIEYNFYAHRAMEGYYAETGRAGAGLTAFDYARVKGLPPLPATNQASGWLCIPTILQCPSAVDHSRSWDLSRAGSASSRSSRASRTGLRLLAVMPREMGDDPVEVCRYFGTRDRINHVHFRNVRVQVPYEKYTETFLDEGEINMFAVMQELVRQKYPRLIFPEHPRALDADRELPDFKSGYPGGGAYAGYVYNVGYTRAMLQAAQHCRNAESGSLARLWSQLSR